MSVRELRELLGKLEDWPKHGAGYPVNPDALSAVVIRLHKLTDEALPALLDVAEAAHRVEGDNGVILNWRGLLDALARLDFGEASDPGEPCPADAVALGIEESWAAEDGT